MKEHAEDALHATRAAVLATVTGVLLIRVAFQLADLRSERRPDRKTSTACNSPQSDRPDCGEEPSVVANTASAATATTVNAATEEYGNMIDMGILIHQQLRSASAVRGRLA